MSLTIVFDLDGTLAETAPDLIDALNFSDPKPVELAREWGVRRLGEQISIRTRSGHDKPVIADVFPAYDEDGGLLIALTPKR